MIDEILQKRPKKRMKDLNIVPILDMLTTVIFFLLMSTSFIEYTKLTLPPASTISSANSSAVPPVAPKMTVKNLNDGYLLELAWGGANPGLTKMNAKSDTLVSQARELVQKFSATYPKEKTIQISMDRLVKYQALISVMDGVKESMPDTVLVSYQEAEAK